MYKAYKFRLYPNEEQRVLIEKTFGCCRFVYNQTLTYRHEFYEREKKSLTRIDCNNYCNRELKKEHEWLREVDSRALMYAIINLDTAYVRFIKKQSGFPKYKSKSNGHQSYTTTPRFTCDIVDFYHNKVKLPKLGWVKVVAHRRFQGEVRLATISRVPSGKYFVSLLVEEEHTKLPSSDKTIGLDLGLRDLCVTSDGVRYENPRYLNRYSKRLAILQRQLAHKKKGSVNYRKKKREIAVLHEKIRNARLDYLHKLSHEIISENQVIVSESLQVKDLAKVSRFNREIYDASWYELTSQLQYKSEWNGRVYIKVDVAYPCNQLCSSCGFRNTELKDLRMREWVCPVCGVKHNRNVNAARNILVEGLKQVS